MVVDCGKKTLNSSPLITPLWETTDSTQGLTNNTVDLSNQERVQLNLVSAAV